MLIVEDHELLGQSLALALREEGMEAELALAESESVVLEAVARFEPQVVLLDLQLEGDIGTSIQLIPPISEAGARVAMLTGVTDRIQLAECVEAGAIALASKSSGFDSLVDLIRALAQGGGELEPAERTSLLLELEEHRRHRLARQEPFARLTPREQAVLGALMDGRSAEGIAHDAVVSVATIRSQIRAVLMKLDVRSQLAAVALARQSGWSPVEETAP